MKDPKALNLTDKQRNNVSVAFIVNEFVIAYDGLELSGWESAQRMLRSFEIDGIAADSVTYTDMAKQKMRDPRWQ